MPYVALPDGSYAEVPKGLTDAQARAFALDKYPMAFVDPTKAQTGSMAALGSGLRDLAGNWGTAVAPMLGQSDEDIRRMHEKRAAVEAEKFKGTTFEDVKKAARDYGVFGEGAKGPDQHGGLSTLLGLWGEQAAQSLPQMGTALGGAYAGGLAGSALGPVGTVVGGGLGALAATAPYFVGSNVNAQIQAQKDSGQQAPLSYGAATAAALPQAALEGVEAVVPLGKPGVSKGVLAAIESLGVKRGEEELIKASERSLLRSTARGAAVGVGVEVPVEVAQQVLERAQAGQSVLDDDAIKDYTSVAVGTVGPGALFGGIGGAHGRFAAKGELEALQQRQRLANSPQVSPATPIAGLLPAPKPEEPLTVDAPAPTPPQGPVSPIPQRQAALNAYKYAFAQHDTLEKGLYDAHNSGNHEAANGIWPLLKPRADLLQEAKQRALDAGLSEADLEGASRGLSGVNARLVQIKKQMAKELAEAPNAEAMARHASLYTQYQRLLAVQAKALADAQPAPAAPVETPGEDLSLVQRKDMMSRVHERNEAVDQGSSVSQGMQRLPDQDDTLRQAHEELHDLLPPPARGPEVTPVVRELGRPTAIFRSREQGKRRDTAVFDLTNLVDAMRKGEARGLNTLTADGTPAAQAQKLRRELIDATLQQADYRRMADGHPPLTVDEKLKAALQLDSRFTDLVERAARAWRDPSGKPIAPQLGMQNGAGMQEVMAKARADNAARLRELYQSLTEQPGQRDRAQISATMKQARAEGAQKLQALWDSMAPRSDRGAIARGVKGLDSVRPSGEYAQILNDVDRVYRSLTPPPVVPTPQAKPATPTEGPRVHRVEKGTFFDLQKTPQETAPGSTLDAAATAQDELEPHISAREVPHLLNPDIRDDLKGVIPESLDRAREMKALGYTDDQIASMLRAMNPKPKAVEPSLDERLAQQPDLLVEADTARELNRRTAPLRRKKEGPPARARTEMSVAVERLRKAEKAGDVAGIQEGKEAIARIKAAAKEKALTPLRLLHERAKKAPEPQPTGNALYTVPDKKPEQTQTNPPEGKEERVVQPAPLKTAEVVDKAAGVAVRRKGSPAKAAEAAQLRQRLEQLAKPLGLVGRDAFDPLVVPSTKTQRGAESKKLRTMESNRQAALEQLHGLENNLPGQADADARKKETVEAAREGFNRRKTHQYVNLKTEREALEGKLTAAQSAKKPVPAKIEAIQQVLAKNAAAMKAIEDYAKEHDLILERASGVVRNKAQAKAVEPALAISDRENAPTVVAPLNKEARNVGRSRKPKFEEDTALDVAEASDYDISFTRDTAERAEGTQGVDAKEAKSVADRILAALPEDVHVTYAATVNDIPPNMRAILIARGTNLSKVQGAVFPDGHVLVVGENHANTSDLEKTFAHELVGHYGVDTILGPEGMQAFTDRMFRQGTEHINEVARALGVHESITPDMVTVAQESPAARMALVRELVAHAAEGKRVAPRFVERMKQFVRDVVHAVKRALGQMGLSSMAKQDTQAVYNLIKESHKALAAGRLGAYRSVGGAAFRTTGTMPESVARALGLSGGVLAKRKSLAERAKTVTPLSLETLLLDQHAPLKEITNRMDDVNAAGQINYYLQKAQNVMSMAAASARSGALKLIKEGDGVYRIAAGGGPSLMSVDKALRPLTQLGMNAQQINELFTLYMLGKHAEQVGWGKVSYKPEIQAQAQKALAASQTDPRVHSVLDEARREYNTYNRGVVDFVAKSGALTKEQEEAMRGKENYIPLYRKGEDGVVRLMLDSDHPIPIGDLTRQPYLHKLLGGDGDIIDYFTSSMQNTILLTDMALQNMNARNLAFELNKLGLVEGPEEKGVVKGLRPGPGPKHPNALRFKVDQGKEMHVVLKTAGTAFEDIPVDLLSKSLEGVPITIPEGLKLLQMPARWLRNGIMMNPVQPFIQLYKDTVMMGATRGVGFNIPALILKATNKYLNGAKLIEELQSKGVVGGRQYIGSLEDVGRFRRTLLEGDGAVHSLLAMQENNLLRAEGAVRAMLYESYINQGFNPRDAEYMAMDAMPYAQRGVSPLMRYMSHMVPFFNAQVVALHSMYRAFRNTAQGAEKAKMRQKMLAAGTTLALGTLAYAAAVCDEDWYKKMPEETRLRNFLVKLPGIDDPFAIPIPFEFGIVFKATAEGIAQGMFTGTPEGKKMREAYVNLLGSSIPSFTPQFLAPALEVGLNKDFYTGSSIESASEEREEPFLRSRDSTSEIAKTLGEAANVSPLKIDHLIKGYTGTLGVAVAAIVSAFTGPAAETGVRPETSASKIPLAGQLFKSADGNALVNLAVDTLKQADQMTQTYKALIEKGRPKEAEQYLQEHADLISSGKLYGSLIQRLGVYKKIEGTIINDSQLTARQKRDQIRELRQARDKEAQEYLQAFKRAA